MCHRILENEYLLLICPPRDIITDGGSRLCKKNFKGLLEKYGVFHDVDSPYHPTTCGQVEVSNHEMKQILAKTVNAYRTDWSSRLHDDLQDYDTSIWKGLTLANRARAQGDIGNEKIED